MATRTLALGVSVLLLVTLVAGPTIGQSQPPLQAVTSLPPGNSMLYTADGVIAGSTSDDPDDFGAWTDDQREMYWDYRFKDGTFVPGPDACDGDAVAATDRAAGLESIDGRTTRICWSDHGVPAVFGDTADDLFYGSGWVAAKLRLFLLDAVRRTARGTLAELAGSGALAEDVRTRYQTYSHDEYTALYEALSPQARVAVDAYVEGVNDWIAFVTGPGAQLLPAEYAALASEPAELTPEDVLAIGVLMTRFVASEGKREFQWVRALKALESEYGTEQGRALFQDFVWVEDGHATTTVLPEEGVFPRTSQTPAERAAAFDELADFATSLPHDLDVGPGTDVEQQGPITAGGDDASANPLPVTNPAAIAAKALQEWTAALEGGSFQVSLAPDKTADGSTLLMSEPQLGYNPVLLMEVQLTGAGYDARGVTVPGIPIVGIGYTPTVAWSLTTGNSKTIDTFVETVRPDSDDDGAPEYLHDGVWKNSDCRDEVVAYREAPEGVPAGPAVFSETHTVCRTVHGPIVAPAIADITTEQYALSYEWHMVNREIDTIEGVLDWNRAKTADDIITSIPRLTWNENIGWADSAGNIGWWHPGLHREKAVGSDLRLPLPGTGAYDNGDYLPVDQLPHVINPERGWIVNWNNKPARGWLDSGGQSETSYPAGVDARVATLADVVAARDDWTFDELVELDRRASSLDFRARHFLPMILDLRGRPDLSELEREALTLLAAWDGSANGPGADMQFAGYDAGEDNTTVGAAPTIFDRFMDVLVDDLFADLRDPRYQEDDGEWTFDLVGRQLQMGRHTYDMSPVLHTALRALDPSTSTLGTARDHLRGRSADQALAEVLAETVELLATELGDDPAAWRSVYTSRSGGTNYGEVCNPTGLVGPCGYMPFVERGTWIHYTGWAPPGATPPAAAPDDGPTTPVTGGGAALGTLVLLLAAGLSIRGRRRPAA